MAPHGLPQLRDDDRAVHGMPIHNETDLATDRLQQPRQETRQSFRGPAAGARKLDGALAFTANPALECQRSQPSPSIGGILIRRP